MRIIGIEGCLPCKVLRERNPGVDYVELPSVGRARTPNELRAKMLLKKHPDVKFPQICDDDMTELLPRDSLGPWV